jgi:hypothetical protein
MRQEKKQIKKLQAEVPDKKLQAKVHDKKLQAKIHDKKQQEEIKVDTRTAYVFKLQEFDKEIADAEMQVASLKSKKMSYIYNMTAQQIMMAHKERKIKERLKEEEVK